MKRNEVLTKIAITRKDFDFIDVQSEHRNLRCQVYVNHDGAHTMVFDQATFSGSVVPMFGPGFVLKADRILRVPVQENLRVVVTSRSIALEALPPKWKPVLPPSGVRPLFIVAEWGQRESNIRSVLSHLN